MRAVRGKGCLNKHSLGKRHRCHLGGPKSCSPWLLSVKDCEARLKAGWPCKEH